MTKASEIIEQLIKGIAACEPCGFKITETIAGKLVITTVEETHRDYVRFYPRIVGAQAKNVRALEYLFRVMLGESLCGKLVVSRPTVTERPPREKFKSNPKWGAANIKGIIEGVAKAIWGSNATRVHCFDQGPDLTIGEVVLHAQTGNSRFYERGAVHAAPLAVVSEEVTKIFDSIGKSHGKELIVTVN